MIGLGHVRAGRRVVLAACLAWLLPITTSALGLHGRIYNAPDGDTLNLEQGNGFIELRLVGIDAPEYNQPFGTEAQAFLTQLVVGQAVMVIGHIRDRYGRLVGSVYRQSDLTNVSLAMVRAGMAWVYRAYNDDERLSLAEAEAQQARRGLWALPEAQRIPPWDWRRRQSDRPAVTHRTRGKDDRPSTTAACDCTRRKTCGQMQSCAEARCYLDVCRRRRLDGDGDGIPCESLCYR